jgi:hypothetical protein
LLITAGPIEGELTVLKWRNVEPRVPSRADFGVIAKAWIASLLRIGFTLFLKRIIGNT